MTYTNTLKVPHVLEKIISKMPDYAYIFSQDGKLLTWNKNIEILTEFSSQELKFKFVTELIHKNDKDRIAKKFMELIAEGDDKERIIEYSIQTKTGKLIPCIAMRSVVLVEGIKYMVGILLETRNIHNANNNKEKLKPKVTEKDLLKRQLQDHYYNIERLNQNAIELQKNLFLNTNAFNHKLINSLPGIFYAYEKVGEKFFLKKWNKNYTIDLGYPEEDLLNKEAHEFFTEKEYEKVKVGVAEVFTSGKAQVEYYTLHKSGKQIPYFYEAYPFEDNGRQYFIGIGLDISERYASEKKQKRQEKEKRKAKEHLESNERELVTTALQVSKTSKIIESTLKNIDRLLEKHSETEICHDLAIIRNDLNSQNSQQDNWEFFKLSFTKVHKVFFKKLKTKHPELSKSETKFCAYLRIHLSSSQISSSLNVTNEAIKKTRYRIRKKLGLSPKDSLEDYISKF